MIGYDALQVYGSPSYYAFKMFSTNRGDSILKVSQVGAPLLGSVTRDSKSGALFIKYVNPQPTPQTVSIDLKGVRSVAANATEILLAADPKETNVLEEGQKVAPQTRRISGIKPVFTHTFPANSITVLRLETK
jgi:alpha-N-arabinofuranosidase